jgi:predicted cobalt transporter CbtA
MVKRLRRQKLSECPPGKPLHKEIDANAVSPGFRRKTETWIPSDGLARTAWHTGAPASSNVIPYSLFVVPGG